MKFTLLFVCLCFSKSIVFGQQIWKIKGGATPVIPTLTSVLQLGVGYPSTVSIAFDASEAGSSILSTIDLLNTLGISSLSGYVEQVGETKRSPQYTAAYQLAINNNLSLGPYIGYATAQTPFVKWSLPAVAAVNPIPLLLPNGIPQSAATDGSTRYNIKMLSYGGKAMWHTNLVEKLDIYGIAGLGVNRLRTITEGDEPPALIAQGLTLDISVPEFSYFGNVGFQYFIKNTVGLYVELGYGIGANIVNAGVTSRLSMKKLNN